jgi:PHD/YefM family antitoxin component YafN of YafNO toxin-antitoxin module
VERIPIQEARKNFGDLVNLVWNARQRFVIHEKGRDRAAVIPLEDLALLESLDGDATPETVRMSLGEVAAHLEEDLALVADRNERIIVCQNGEDAAALVPDRYLAMLENLDQRMGLEAARELLDTEPDETDDDDT